MYWASTILGLNQVLLQVPNQNDFRVCELDRLRGWAVTELL
jgi:hypothetical protein